MKKIELDKGVTRVILSASEGSSFEPVAFTDAAGTFLTQTGFRCEERPVYRLTPATGDGDVRQTANGEVVVFDDGETRRTGTSHTAELRFACSEGEILTGLGQHEE